MSSRLEESKKIINKIGQRIKLLRLEKDLSQLDLSTICDMEKTSISRIEAGRTNFTIKTLLKISKALEISLTELVDISELEND